MAGEIIRQGDSTSHGGTVLEGSITDICHGKPIAYLGHKVHCPKCKGTFPIVEGVLTTSFYGKGVAVAGMKTACGALLIASQFTDIVETGGGGGGGAVSSSAAATPSTAERSAAPVDGAGTARGAATPGQQNEKKITAIFWTYGRDETPITGDSRFYVDLNLHVDTENYLPGDMIDIAIEDDEGHDVLDGIKKIALRAKVGSDGKAKLMNAFAGKTLITLTDSAGS